MVWCVPLDFIVPARKGLVGVICRDAGQIRHVQPGIRQLIEAVSSTYHDHKVLHSTGRGERCIGGISHQDGEGGDDDEKGSHYHVDDGNGFIFDHVKKGSACHCNHVVCDEEMTESVGWCSDIDESSLRL